MKLGSKLMRSRALRGGSVAASWAAQREGSRAAAPAARRQPKPLSEQGDRASIFPDLLHDEPQLCLDEASLSHALSFAFVAGSAGGAI